MVYSIKLYKTIINKEMQRFFTYRVNILSGCLTALFMLGARYALWVALFATGNAAQSSLLETMTYFVIYDIVADIRVREIGLDDILKNIYAGR